jgi:hypothetical protein
MKENIFMDLDKQEWLQAFTGFGSAKMEEVGILAFFVLMLISLASSLLIGFLYVKFYKSRATGSQVHRAFPLLGLSITAIFICIQFSLPLSLGLLGALSIVRFRTPIKEPEEIGFIMLVVATSLCCATFNILFLGVILSVAVTALLIVHLGRGILKGGLNDGMLIVSLPAAVYRSKKAKLLELLEKKMPRGRIDSISENEDESIVTYSFIQLDKDTLLKLQGELKNLANQAKANVFFNRSGEI